MRSQSPHLTLPRFWALDVDGQPGVDDMGLGRDGRLVISQRAMDVLVRHRVEQAVFMQYGPPTRAEPRSSP